MSLKHGKQFMFSQKLFHSDKVNVSSFILDPRFFQPFCPHIWQK